MNLVQFFPKVTDADMKLISQPLDFLGQNIYNAVTVRAGEDGKAVRAARYDGFPQTAIGWPVTPEVLYWRQNLCRSVIRSRL